jgi:predicted nuclease of predicted toxin-antitoxin system
MVKLYADEQFPLPVIKILRALEYDILTVQDAGKAEQKIPDLEVLQYATSLNRAVLTMNRRDFIRLHNQVSHHEGIVICRSSTNWEKIAQAIHQSLSQIQVMSDQLIRVKMPA